MAKMNVLLRLLSISPLLVLPFLPEVACLALQNGTGLSSKSRILPELYVDLVGFHGKLYTAEMYVGEDFYDMRMLLDTSSSDTWFASTWCPGSVAECGERRFDCTPDQDCYPTEPDLYRTRHGLKQMDVCYDHPRGCITATVSRVTMKFPSGHSICQEWTVGMLNSSSYIFGNRPHFDGILGLGRPENLNVVTFWDPIIKPKTPFQKLFECEEIPEVFYLYLHRNLGKLYLGEPSPASYRPPLKEYLGASPYMWILVADEIQFGTFEWWNQPCEFNTGWAFIGVPDQYFGDLLTFLHAKKDPEHHRYMVKCPSASLQYPDLTFSFNGDEYSLSEYRYMKRNPVYTGYCELLLAPSHQDYWVLGIPWFEKYFTGFEFPQNLIYIAEAV